MTLTRRNLLKASSGIAAGAALGGLPRMAFAQDQTWDISDEYGENSLTGQTAKFFVDQVENTIGDELGLTYHGGGALGYDSSDHFDAVESGAVQMAVTLMTQLGGIDPLFEMSSLPFLVQSLDEAHTLWTISKQEYAKVFDEYNMVLLWAMPNPPSGIHAKTPITSTDALEGLRIRTYDVNGTKTLRAAGASPLQISWSDLVPQLSTGGVDAVLTSADGGVQLSAWDYLSDFTELNYAMGLFMAHVNKDAYMALPEEARQSLQTISEETDKHAWKIVEDSIGASYKIMRDNGMNITTDVPQEVFDHLQDAGAEVKEEWLNRVGDRGERILNELEKTRS